MVKTKKSTTKTATKATAKKTTLKKPAKIKENIVLEFSGRSLSNEDLIDNVKTAWKNSGHTINEIKNMSIYAKPEEFKAYYVINDTEQGCIDI